VKSGIWLLDVGFQHDVAYQLPAFLGLGVFVALEPISHCVHARLEHGGKGFIFKRTPHDGGEHFMQFRQSFSSIGQSLFVDALVPERNRSTIDLCRLTS
jgi:hypothetical protein